MVRLPPRVEPSRCLRARRPVRDDAAHPRRDFLMVRPDRIEHACDYFPCTHTRIRHIGTWVRFAAVKRHPGREQVSLHVKIEVPGSFPVSASDRLVLRPCYVWCSAPAMSSADIAGSGQERSQDR